MSMPKPATGLSRRNMMIAGGGTVAAIGAFAASPLSNPLVSEVRGALAGQVWVRGMLSLANGTFEEWQSLVGASFSLGGGATMRLAGVRALQASGSRPYDVARRQAFVAFFDPGAGQSMPSDLIYTATHAQYGPVQLFLTQCTSAPRSRADARGVQLERVPPPVRAAAAFRVAYRPEREDDSAFLAALYASARGAGVRRRSAGRRRCSLPSSASSSTPSTAIIAPSIRPPNG